MSQSIHFSTDVPVKGKYEVIVVGGGIAGVSAALAAGRKGASVLLLEKQTWLGGLATNGLVNYWEPLDNGRGKLIMHGLPEELFNASIEFAYDTLPDEWSHGKVTEPSKPTNARCTSLYSAGLFAVIMLKLLKDAGVDILYDVAATDPIMDGGHCRGLITEGKSGRSYYEADMVIDASGDAEVLAKAGVPTVDGNNYHTYYAEGVSLSSCRRAVENNDISLAYEHFSGGGSNLHGDGHPEGMPLYHGVGTELINEYLQNNQLELLQKQAKPELRSERCIHLLPCIPQLRTSRRIDGDATFTGEEKFVHCPTSVGVSVDFEVDEWLFEVPYGTLVRTGYDNLITCGRSVSACDRGWDILRVIPPAALTGQAAGLAAVQAIRTSKPIAQIDVSALQQTLSDDGVVIHFDDSLITESEPSVRLSNT